MRRFVAVLALYTFAFGLASATPSESSPLGKGALEINPSLAYSHNSYSSFGSTDFTTTTVNVSGFLGYFVSDMIEVGGAVLVSYQSFDFGAPIGSSSSTSAGLTGGVAVNFVSSGNVVPFLRGSLGFLSNSGDAGFGTETTVIAPLLEGGLRVMVGSSASVNFVVGYQHQTSALGVQDESANVITLGVGVSVFPVLKH